MENDFRPNDLVRIKDQEYNHISQNVYWNENVFRILSINKMTVELSDIDSEVPSDIIEPIPIDGKADACIYYAPAFMASMGESIHEHKDAGTSYYVNRFGTVNVDGHTLKDEFLTMKFRYVHEVQRWLQENGSRDELRVNQTLKSR